MTQPPQGPPPVGTIHNGYQWNGTAWVPVPNAAPGSVPGTQTRPHPGSVPASTPVVKRWWFWVLVIGLVIILTALGGVLAWLLLGPRPVPVVPPITPTTQTSAAATGGTEESPAATDEGVFTSFTTEGSGSQTVPLPAGATSGIVEITHTGDGAFFAILNDSAGEPAGEMLVSTIGAYKGTVPFGFIALEEPGGISVETDGDWSVTVKPLEETPALTLPTSGSGDAVFLFADGPADVTLSYSGYGNFSVMSFGDDGTVESLINEIGDTSASVTLPKTSLIQVHSNNGEWTIDR